MNPRLTFTVLLNQVRHYFENSIKGNGGDNGVLEEAGDTKIRKIEESDRCVEFRAEGMDGAYHIPLLPLLLHQHHQCDPTHLLCVVYKDSVLIADGIEAANGNDGKKFLDSGPSTFSFPEQYNR